MFVCLGKWHIGVGKQILEFIVCKLEGQNKRNKFLEIYFVYWIMKSNSNKFEVEH